MPEEEEVFEEPVEDAGDEQPFEAGDEQPREAQPQAPARTRGREERGDRYRFVERSEGLRRRGTPLPAAEPARPAAGGRPERRDEDRPRGRRRRGGRGGRPERRGPAPAREPLREPALPPAPRPAPRAERLPPAEPELADAAQEALDVLLGFADVEAEADFFRNEDRLEVELWGPDDHLLLQDEGQLLLAIEHLLPRMLRGIYGDSMAVRVDCNDFHFEREERLRQLALQTADDVRRRGRPRTLEELDPAERRIVHLALADDPDVTTDSIGDGFYKRLKVIPREEGT
jgi:spoIIIJ-associated protein